LTIATFQIVLAVLFVGLVSGFVMHRADFCIAGAFRDLFLFRKTFMLRMVLLLVALSMLLFDAARRTGLLPFYPFPLPGAISPANLVGGLMFGIGMVLAGGCVVGTLYRAGSGNFPAMASVAGLVAGSGLYAEIQPAWSSFHKSTMLFPGMSTLPQLTGLDPTWFVAALTIPAGFLIFRWAREGSLHRETAVEGFIQPWVVAIVLAFLGLASWLATGMPMGITTSYAKAAAWIESCVMPGHFDGLAYFKAAPLDVVLPNGYRLIGGPGAALDGIAVIQFPLIGGILAGSFISAVSLREFRIRFRVPPIQIASGLAGGVVMGLASRMAPGCNVWHVMGGLPIFSVPSILFVLGLFPGAWIGSGLLKRLV
jgi:uncharacterized membrane protein YedE/YeeE